MPDGFIGFESEGDFDRMALAVRKIEGMDGPGGALGPFNRRTPLRVKITNQKRTDDGYYEASVIDRHIESIPSPGYSSVLRTDDSGWTTIGDSSKVLARSLNGEPLTKGIIYDGYYGGTKDGFAVCWVTRGETAAAIEVVSSSEYASGLYVGVRKIRKSFPASSWTTAEACVIGEMSGGSLKIGQTYNSLRNEEEADPNAYNGLDIWTTDNHCCPGDSGGPPGSGTFSGNHGDPQNPGPYSGCPTCGGNVVGYPSPSSPDYIPPHKFPDQMRIIIRPITTYEAAQLHAVVNSSATFQMTLPGGGINFTPIEFFANRQARGIGWAVPIDVTINPSAYCDTPSLGCTRDPAYVDMDGTLGCSPPCLPKAGNDTLGYREDMFNFEGVARSCVPDGTGFASWSCREGTTGGCGGVQYTKVWSVNPVIGRVIFGSIPLLGVVLEFRGYGKCLT